MAAYKQADDPLSHPLQQLGVQAEGSAAPTGAPASKQLPCSLLYHGDIAADAAAKPGRRFSRLLLPSSQEEEVYTLASYQAPLYPEAV